LAARRSPREIEDDDLFFEAFNSMVEYLDHKTNCSVIREPDSEADDLIATWIQSHPADQHIIVSSDSDFFQLLAENVKIYNGVSDQIITIDGVFDGKKGTPVMDKKTGAPVKTPDPQWLLFEKCVRGDTSDNIFSAYPGARLKGTKNKTGITEAFADRLVGGYNYNNFMLQRWTDHEGRDHRVRDDYERNRMLIDLTAQPDHIKQRCAQVVQDAVNKPRISQVGIYFYKFCAKWNLQRMSEIPNDYTEFLNAHC
jgi:hypothetical protein